MPIGARENETKREARAEGWGRVAKLETAFKQWRSKKASERERERKKVSKSPEHHGRFIVALHCSPAAHRWD